MLKCTCRSIIINLLKKFRKVIRVLGVSNPPSFPVLRVLDYIFEQCDKCVWLFYHWLTINIKYTVEIRYGFFPIKSAFLIAFRSRNWFLSHKWTCPSKRVTKILQKGTIWGTVSFILLFDGTLQYLNRTNRLKWKLHFLERQWC